VHRRLTLTNFWRLPADGTFRVFNQATRFLREFVDPSGTTSVIKKFFLCHYHSWTGRVGEADIGA